MREIDDARYSFRKPIDYDNDFAVLFYKGKKVARGLFEMFKDSWCEEACNCDNVEEFFHDIRVRTYLDDKDSKESWQDIWDGLDWDASSKSYKYGSWELVILDI